MRIITDGLIISEQTVGERDKLVTIFTRSEGIIRCFARGVKSLKSSNACTIQALCYCRLTIFSNGSKYVIDDSEILSFYYDLRNDLEKLALVQYFCEVAMALVPDATPDEEALNLLLNSIYLVQTGKKSMQQIKAVYETRILHITDHTPQIFMCKECGCYESDTMFFLYHEDSIICENCFQRNKPAASLTRGALAALRHAVFSEPKKVFSFSVNEDSLDRFADCSEKRICIAVPYKLSALEFYKQIRNFQDIEVKE